MSQLKPVQELTIALLLMGIMIATRFHHFGSVTHLPDASWAIFITAGFFLRRLGYFLVFMTAAAVIDYLAITRFGVSSFCISSAYGFLVLAYGALWLGGRWMRSNYISGWKMLPRLVTVVLVSAAVAFLISNGSFYLLSGKFGEMSFGGYISQLFRYFPYFLAITAGYVAVFAAVFVVVEMLVRHDGESKPTRHA